MSFDEQTSYLFDKHKPELLRGEHLKQPYPIRTVKQRGLCGAPDKNAEYLNKTQNAFLLPTYVRDDFPLARWNGCGWIDDYGAMIRVPGLKRAIADPTELIF